MRRRLLVLSLLVACPLTFGLRAAPIPKETLKEPVLYYPTKVGAKWVYEADGKEYTDVVTAVEQKVKERSWIVTVGRLNQGEEVIFDTEWEVSDKGLVLTKRVGDEGLLAWCYLTLPHQPEAKWKLMPDRKTLQCVARAPEKVNVPAGEYNALGVELYSGEDLIETRWYASGVGLVKRNLFEKTTLVLKSFTLGKG